MSASRPEATPAPILRLDILESIGWLAAQAGAEPVVDTAHTRAAGGFHPDDHGTVQDLEHAAAAHGVAVRPTQVRVRDAGRTHPLLIVAPGAGPGLCPLIGVSRARFGRLRVDLFEGGQRLVRYVRTSGLAALLGVPGSAVVTGYAPIPELPLDPMVDRDHGLHALRRVWALLRIDSDDLKVSVIYGVVISILALAVPIAVQSLVNTIAFGSLLQPLVVLVAVVGIVLAASGVIRLFQARTVEAVQCRMFVRAVFDVARRFTTARPDELRRLRNSDLAYRALELPVMQKATAILLVEGIEVALRLVIGAPLLAVYHPLLLAFALIMIVAMVAVLWVGSRGAIPTAIDESIAKYAAVSWLEEIARLPAVYGSAEGRDRASELTYRHVRRYRDTRRLHFTRLARLLVGGIVVYVLGHLVLLGMGGWLVMRGQLSLGQLVAAEIVFASIGIAVVKLYKQFESVFDLTSAVHKFGELVDLPLAHDAGEPPPAQLGDLEVADVTVSTADGHPLLGPVSLTIPDGARFGVHGAPGTGKSLLLACIAHARVPTSGRITLDGVEREHFDAALVRDQIAFACEDDSYDHVAGTLLDNLRLFAPDASLTRVHEVCRWLELEALVASHPDGIELAVERTGAPLATTFRRRLVVARVLLAGRPWQIFDGALDQLDLSPPAWDALLDRLYTPAAGTVVVVASSRADVLARCTQTLELRTAGGAA